MVAWSVAVSSAARRWCTQEPGPAYAGAAGPARLISGGEAQRRGQPGKAGVDVRSVFAGATGVVGQNRSVTTADVLDGGAQRPAGGQVDILPAVAPRPVTLMSQHLPHVGIAQQSLAVTPAERVVASTTLAANSNTSAYLVGADDTSTCVKLFSRGYDATSMWPAMSAAGSIRAR
ncbi:hypothetical protein ACN267_21015 [Micromonospora sp. WMMD734]|uniref:hypothetical protein n=1 Tax=Micromonospora sp. WMMD734 TaxID=3404129 RepID=UPI003B948E51